MAALVMSPSPLPQAGALASVLSTRTPDFLLTVSEYYCLCVLFVLSTQTPDWEMGSTEKSHPLTLSIAGRRRCDYNTNRSKDTRASEHRVQWPSSLATPTSTFVLHVCVMVEWVKPGSWQNNGDPSPGRSPSPWPCAKSTTVDKVAVSGNGSHLPQCPLNPSSSQCNPSSRAAGRVNPEQGPSLALPGSWSYPTGWGVLHCWLDARVLVPEMWRAQREHGIKHPWRGLPWLQ